MVILIDPELDEKRPAFVDTMIKDKVGSHLFEKILQVTSPNMFTTIYSAFFRGHLVSLSFHAIANYVVQNLFQYTQNAAQLTLMMEEVLPETGRLLFRGRANVVCQMVESAARLEACQKEAVKAIQGAFEVYGDEDKKQFVNFMLSLQPSSVR